MKTVMTARRMIQIPLCVLPFLLHVSILHGYEPTYNEILIQRERLESFCKLTDNQRKFDICERYKLIKGKLPDRVDEIIIFRRIYEAKEK